MGYDLELERVVNEINCKKSKLVCIQLADGLKTLSGNIQKEIESKTDCQVLIWAGSCFGACDVPVELEKWNIDLLIQFGHSKFKS